MNISGLHHVAYRCKDAQQTVDFYTRMLDLDYSIAAAEDRVPSTQEESPYMHIFFRMGDGSYVAFFEIPQSPPMGRDPNTPAWVQHLALKVEDEATLLAYKERLEANGIEVIGPVDHKICQSIYFFDPNGHRLELALDTTTAEMAGKLGEIARPMLQEWNKTKRAPEHARWLHEDLW
jgi:catechol 2,3-dioxygenase-like lactoylglutathione lyase family enzyme